MSKEILSEIIKTLKAPKNQYNSFGKYKYRSVEDIQEGLKQVMPEGCYVNLSDEIALIGDRFYVKATATFYGHDGFEQTSFSYAREPQQKKGMDDCQITGSASSYARKYALGGLFQIDDTKDADSEEKSEQKSKLAHKPLSQGQIKRLYAIMKNAGTDENRVIPFIKEQAKIEHINQLTKDQYDYWCNYIENAGKKMQQQKQLEEKPY